MGMVAVFGIFWRKGHISKGLGSFAGQTAGFSIGIASSICRRTLDWRPEAGAKGA